MAGVGDGGKDGGGGEDGGEDEDEDGGEDAVEDCSSEGAEGAGSGKGCCITRSATTIGRSPTGRPLSTCVSSVSSVSRVSCWKSVFTTTPNSILFLSCCLDLKFSALRIIQSKVSAVVKKVAAPVIIAIEFKSNLGELASWDGDGGFRKVDLGEGEVSGLVTGTKSLGTKSLLLWVTAALGKAVTGKEAAIVEGLADEKDAADKAAAKAANLVVRGIIFLIYS